MLILWVRKYLQFYTEKFCLSKLVRKVNLGTGCTTFRIGKQPNMPDCKTVDWESSTVCKASAQNNNLKTLCLLVYW